jgi:cytochrome c oxidase subunit II
MASYEKVFLWSALCVLVLFLAAITYSAFVMHIALPTRQGRIVPRPGEPLAAAVLRTPPFNHPGVREIAPGKYLAVVLGQIWTFTPREIDLPAGAEVTFEATSLDVTHGFFIPGTRVNMMLIPGYISVEKCRFTKPGNYVLLCHEYCGLLHHTMAAKVVVK